MADTLGNPGDVLGAVGGTLGDLSLDTDISWLSFEATDRVSSVEEATTR